MALYSPKAAEKYGFPYTKDPALAKITAARMWHWLPVIEEGNGDLICIDMSKPKSDEKVEDKPGEAIRF